MERIDTIEKQGPAVSLEGARRDQRFVDRGRRFIGAALSVGLLALAADAHARPEPIPAPVEEPEPEESPGTGQELPEDPEDPPSMPAPDGDDCIEEGSQANCDPDRPDDATPGNTPGPGWYDDMHNLMYGLQESLDSLIEWAADEEDEDLDEMRYWAMWLRAVVQQYYALAFDAQGMPREYSYGTMTRGDFNFVFYFWVLPVYHGMLYYAAQYYERHKDDPQKVSEYRDHLGQVVEAYHGLALCNYGLNGEDPVAREDLRAHELEERAGLR